MAQDFENKVVVITGGAHGIGLATSEGFKRDGAQVCIIDTAPGAGLLAISAGRKILNTLPMK